MRPVARQLHVPATVALAAAALSALAGLAIAQPEGRGPRQPADQPPPVLRGPAVEETGIPGTERAFAMDGVGGPENRMMDREIPMPEFMAAIAALNAPETPAELHLTPDQREALGAIAREHAMAVRSYMAGHREEIESLGAALGLSPDELRQAADGFSQRLAAGEARARMGRGEPGTGPGAPSPEDRARVRAERQAARAGGPPAGQDDQPQPRAPRTPEQLIRERVGENPTPEQRDAIARLREIRQGGPSALEAQTRAYNALSEPQRGFVQARLEESRERMQAQRGEMYVREMAQRLEGGEAGRPGGAPPLGDGSAGERLHKLIDTLSPEEQAMLLRLLENRLPELRERARQGQLGGQFGGQGQPGSPGRRPTPPTMDQINVPPADPV